jgi:MoaA/NifB/PqqE/SkfB family radical SAM enzyme
MFRLIREEDLAVRFYGPERLILSRRNGSRYGVAGHLASLFHKILDTSDLASLYRLASQEGEVEGPLRPLAGTFRSLLSKLDQALPRGHGDLLNKVSGLAAYSMQQRVPIFGLFEVTYVCNLRCHHCYVLHKVSELKPAQLDTETCRRVLDSLAELGCLDVTLSGGETTLHQDYRSLISYAKDLHLYTALKTNALTMTQRNAEIYAEDPAHETQVSLHGSTADIHDRMTALPGSFEKTMAGLRALAAVGIQCKIFVTIWKDHAHQLSAMRDLIEELGHIPRYDDIIHGRLNGDSSPRELRISPEVRSRLVDEGFLRPFAPAPCTAGAMKVKVSAEGGVTTCELLPESFGNIHRDSLENIWRSESYSGYGRRIREIAKAPTGLLPIISSQKNACPGLNLLNTGRLEGETTL